VVAIRDVEFPPVDTPSDEEVHMRRLIACSSVLLLVQVQPGAAQSGPDAKRVRDEKVWIEMERGLEDDDLERVGAQDCGSEARQKSRNFDTPTVLRFKNATTRAVRYYWVNYEGKREQERELKAGEVQNIRTYLTHPFVVVDATGRCAAIYLPRPGPGLVVIRERNE
jgi:hypothetical protein